MLCQKGKRQTFHEISYNPIEISRQIVSESHLPADAAVKIESAATASGDCINKPAQEEARNIVWAYKRHVFETLPDSVLTKEHINGALYIPKAAKQKNGFRPHLVKALKKGSKNADTTLPVEFSYFSGLLKVEGPCKSILTLQPFKLTKTINLPVKAMSAGTFFRKHPGFGFWALLILVQFSIYLPMLFVVTGATVALDKKVVSDFTITRPHKYWNPLVTCFLIVLVIVVSIGVLAFNSFAKEKFITAELFFSGLDMVFNGLFLIGYSLAIACFTGYMVISGFSKNIERKVKTDNANNDTAKGTLKEIKKYYTMINTIAAITLSLTVLSTSVMFAAINNMGFYKKLSLDIGYSLYPSELVYLYGALHSILLMMFLLPARLNVINLETTIAETDPAITQDTSKLNLPNILRIILVSLSPLIASALQPLLEALIPGS